MWQERLPRESAETAPRLPLGRLAWGLASRLLVATVLLTVVAAVVLGSFGLGTIAELLGAAVVLALAALAAEPMWRRTRHRATTWWR
ncbi:MAG: hypothetical protein ACYDEA_08480 [Candidatus Dormibacteria bacterium]